LAGTKKLRICFHARSYDDKVFELFDYYSNDVKIFKELGHEVIFSYNSKTIPVNCDLYFIWWWSSGIIPLIKANILGKKTITIGNIHYSDPSPQGYFQRPFYIRMFIRFCLRHSDVQLATANIELEDIKKLNAKNPVMIYHAIDMNKYRFNDINNREKIICTLTQLTKENIKRKKVYEIIDAFVYVIKEFPDYKLCIAGRTEDDGYPALSEYIRKLGISGNVIFPGRVSENEKVKLYQQCMVYVQPTSYEGFGMAIAENMACGTPVVTSPNGAVPEVVGEDAVMVNPDKPEDISIGILRILKDKDLQKKLSVNGNRRINDLFSYDIRKRKISDLLESVVR
jgi:glycosyltransferase involved in cell wall biosynthesis